MVERYVVNGNKTRTLPRAVYYQVVWLLSDYDRLKKLVDEAAFAGAETIVFYAGESEGLMPQSVVDEAARKLAAIDRAVKALPEEYRMPILLYYAREERLPDEAADNTWKKWKRLFIETLARELNLY